MPQVLKETLVGYDGHTIYRVYIKEQNKVIWVKNLYIFKNYKAKKSIKISDYFNNLLTFQDFYYNNDDNNKLERQIPCISQKVNVKKRKSMLKKKAKN